MSSLAPHVDMLPVPRVEIVVDPGELPAGTETVTIRRRAEQRDFLVRGGIDRPAATTVVVMDFEAPFGVDAAYTVLCYGHDGAYLGAITLGSALLDVADTVIQQPLNPRLSIVVERRSAMAGPIVRTTPGELVYPEGEGLPTLVGTGPRRGVERFAVELVTTTFAQADALQATLGTYEQPQLQVWLIRTPPPQRIPRVFFCAVPALTETEATVRFGREEIFWRADVTEVPPPAPGLSPAVLRYSDLMAVFDTYSEISARYSLYSDIMRDQSLVGAAG